MIMKKILASIDIGSYTARMLIAEKDSGTNNIVPISRFRDYINIADGFEEPGIIKDEAISRTINVLKRFAFYAKEKKVTTTYAVGTGLIRSAINKDSFINKVREETEIEIQPISGRQEALFTAEGVIHALGIEHKKNFIIIDIGGGSTEFFIRRDRKNNLFSIPIGAAILHNKYISSDPPEEVQIYKLCDHIRKTLRDFVSLDYYDMIIGTGGTITSLAAVIYNISLKSISPENINGKNLTNSQIRNVLNKIKKMDIEQRINILNLDRNRAKVIIAGTIILLKIMDLFKADNIIVSLSNLLEGILLRPQILKEEVV